MRIIVLMFLAAVSAAAAGNDGWISLFDGKTLKGWRVAAKPEDVAKNYWSVQDGAITCDSRGRKQHNYVWLMGDREYTDFELKMKIRSFRESPGNSGVQVRSRYDEQANVLDGPQADIHPPGPFRNGLLYDETRGVRHWIWPVLPNSKMEPEQGFKNWKWKHADEGDGWNDFSIECRGTKIKTMVNGLLVADYDGAGVLDDEVHKLHNVGMRGYIALQLHNGDDLHIQYKDVYIKPAPEKSAADRLAWWKEDRFGMFMHWGLYAITAGEWKGQPVPGIGEWIMNKGKIPVREYEQLAGRFNPARFDAEAWVRLAKAAGQRYIVITAKHHDGFALWHSQVSKFNVYDATPFHRDILAELVQACRRNGMRIGFYYSQTQDWHEPDGDGNNWDFKPPEKNFDRYFHAKAIPQVRELLTGYGPLAFIWFDTPKIITTAQSKELVDLVHSLQPDCLVNARVGNDLGDFKGVDDQVIPAKVQDADWETVVSLNDSWGFKRSDVNWKPAPTLIRELVDVVSKSGFFSLNVGPDADGVIPQPEVERLRAVGDWLRVNGEAVYGAKPSPYPYEFEWGSVTAKPGRLYLEISQWPSNGEFTLYGLANKVDRAYALASRGAAIPFSQRDLDGRHELHLKLPHAAPDAGTSVVALEIEGTPQAEKDLVQQPDGKVTLSCAFAKVDGKHVNIDPRGVAQNWSDPSTALDWNFKLYRPGTYQMVLLTNVKRNASDWTMSSWSGDHQVQVSVGDHKIEGKIVREGEVVDPRSPNFPDVRTAIGQISLSPGEQHLKVQALKINPEGKLGFRLHAIQLIPVVRHVE